MSYKHYDAYLSITKSTPFDIYKDEFQELVNTEYENATTIKTVLHNGNSITVRVVGKFNAETLSKQNDNYQKIIFKTPDYKVNVGDIFEFDNAKWICTDITFTTVSKSCTVTKANNEIKVYKNNILYKVPCIVEDITRLYSMGIEENKYIIQPSTNIIVRVPNNEITALISRDDIYKIGLSNYKVVDISDIINQGLIILKLEWTAEEQMLPNYNIRILNGDNIQVNVSDGLQINCEVLDGNVVLSPTPPLIYTSSDETIATINNGIVTILKTGMVVLTVSLENDTNVKDTIVVNIVDVPQHNYNVAISGNTSIIKGKTATYTATFTDNGQIITEQSEFYLTADDGISTTTLASITSQDANANTCVITANGTNIGYVKLWCKNITGTIVSEPFRIQIKNVF